MVENQVFGRADGGSDASTITEKGRDDYISIHAPTGGATAKVTKFK